MKELVRTVRLRFFNDDVDGKTGLTHENTYSNSQRTFNAFYDEIGIFHDVFEHAHEHHDPHFRGEYSMNVGGEMAAMGAMWYFLNELYVENRYFDDNMKRWPAESMIGTTWGFIVQSIADGEHDFGSTLNSNVPKQAEVDNEGLEIAIKAFWKRVKELEVGPKGREYRKSVTLAKIANLHRYGYLQAEALVPNTTANQNTIEKFITFWKEFTANNDADMLQDNFDGIVVNLYREGKDISWDATLFGNLHGLDDLPITHSSNMEDDIITLGMEPDEE